MVPLARIVTTYRALDLGLGVQFIGLLSAVFALLPVLFTVAIGRFNDRGAVARATVIGGLSLLLSSAMLWLLPPSLPMLLVSTAILGIGQTLCLSSMQLIASTSSSRMHRDAILANYMVAMALGQAIGPMFVGLPMDGAWILVIPVVGSGLLLVAALGLLRVVPRPRRYGDGNRIPLRQIAATRGLPWIVLTGSICVTAQDLLLAFMPVLGEERGIAPVVIGMLLSIRAIASMVSRLTFSRAVHAIGRLRLMLASAVIGGAGLLLVALPLPIWALALALVVAGFGLGIALTSSIAMTLEIAPPAAGGTALSLRLTANRISQFAVPLLAGFIVAPMGAAGIFGLTGAALIGATVVRPRGLSGQPR